jgi:hypothetical protein
MLDNPSMPTAINAINTIKVTQRISVKPLWCFLAR